MIDPVPESLEPVTAILDSVKIGSLNGEDLSIRMGTGNANIIGIIPNSIVTRHLVEKADSLNGYFQPN